MWSQRARASAACLPAVRPRPGQQRHARAPGRNVALPLVPALGAAERDVQRAALDVCAFEVGKSGCRRA